MMKRKKKRKQKKILKKEMRDGRNCNRTHPPKISSATTRGACQAMDKWQQESLEKSVFHLEANEFYYKLEAVFLVFLLFLRITGEH